jgi:hypothetical protein
MAFQRRKTGGYRRQGTLSRLHRDRVLLGIQLAELFKLEHFRASLLHNAAEHYIRSGGVVVF